MSSPLLLPLGAVKGVGPRREVEFARVGIVTLGDLLHRFPIRYENRSNPRPIAELAAGTTAAVVGTIVRCALRRTRRPGFTVFEVLVRDGSGDIAAVWFNQRFLRDVFAAGQRVALFGKVEARGTRGLQLVSPQHEILDLDASADAHDEMATAGLHTGRVVPVYERIGPVTPRVQRRLTFEAIGMLPPTLEDPLPAELRDRLGLPPLRTALADTHFPSAEVDFEALGAFRTPAQRRLVFEEFFLFQLGLALRREASVRERKPFSIVVTEAVRRAAREVLPFTLTAGQKAALREIVADMQRPHPMNRLLQGDVGAGKTIVALLAAVVALENGLQVALMAPTEILAEQHYATLRRLLDPTPYGVALLTGSTGADARRRLLSGLAAGREQFVVGTHALVQEAVEFARLGLAIVDEQHRFGVAQRAELRQKGLCPDVLVMTATPIPRTLALTVYGDLDVSVIRDRPPGRKPVATVAHPEPQRRDAYAFVRSELERGRQAYVVFPLVEQSDKLDVRAATEMADHLAQEEFPAYRVGLLHGRMPPDAKERVMGAFHAGALDVLVSTTVIEVGVDVPNATVMVVEHAERFGLSQLHQLRGRVGRGTEHSHCLLLYQSPLSDDAGERLGVMTRTDDGFAIAEKDLALRGPGDFFGTRQSGLPRLRVGDLVRDHTVMQQAHDEALAWVECNGHDHPLAKLVEETWTSRFGLGSVG